jgi:hypothetical protein
MSDVDDFTVETHEATEIPADVQAADAVEFDATGVDEPETPVSEPETPDPAPVEAADDDRNADGTYKKGRSPAKRIAQLTYEREEAKRRADALEARLAALEQSTPAPAKVETPAPVAPVQSGKPTLKSFTESGQYETYEDAHEAFLEARDAWRDAEKARTDEGRQRSESFNGRWKTFAEKTPDLATTMQTSELTPDRISDVMTYAIMQSERGPELLYLLAKHPQEAIQLGEQTKTLGPDAAQVVLDLLNAKFPPATAAPSGPASAASRYVAPSPIKPVGTAPVAAETSPEDIDDIDQYITAANKRHGWNGRKVG